MTESRIEKFTSRFFNSSVPSKRKFRLKRFKPMLGLILVLGVILSGGYWMSQNGSDCSRVSRQSSGFFSGLGLSGITSWFGSKPQRTGRTSYATKTGKSSLKKSYANKRKSFKKQRLVKSKKLKNSKKYHAKAKKRKASAKRAVAQR